MADAPEVVAGLQYLLPPDGYLVAGTLGLGVTTYQHARHGRMQLFGDQERTLVLSSWDGVWGPSDGLGRMVDKKRGEHSWSRSDRVQTRRLRPQVADPVTSCVWWTVGHPGTRPRTGVELIGVGFRETELVGLVPSVVIDAPGSARMKELSGMTELHEGRLPSPTPGMAWTMSVVFDGGTVVLRAFMQLDVLTHAFARATGGNRFDHDIVTLPDLTERERASGITSAAVKVLTPLCTLQAVGHGCSEARLVSFVQSLRRVDSHEWEQQIL